MKSLLKAHKNPEMNNNANNNYNTRDTRDNYNNLMDNLQNQSNSGNNVDIYANVITKKSPQKEVNSIKFPIANLTSLNDENEHTKEKTGRFTQKDLNNNYDINIKNESLTEKSVIDIITKANNYGDAFKLTGDESSDIYKLKTANESLLDQVKLLKQKITEDKVRYENSLNMVTTQSKNKEVESLAFVERLRDRHKHEIVLLEDAHKNKIKSHDQEIKNLKMELDLQLFNEKERLAINFQSDLENSKEEFKKSLANQKVFSDNQIKDLKKQLDQQLELNKIVHKVDLSTRYIEELVEKYANEKYKTLGVDQEVFESKQRTLNEFEERLKNKERLLNNDKEELEKRKTELEERDKLKNAEYMEEKEKIDKELKRLQDLQNSMRTLELNMKEKTEKDKLELFHRENLTNMEIEGLRADYKEKMNELEYKLKILEDDKNYFKTYKDEILK